MTQSNPTSFKSPFDPEELINLSSKAPSVSNYSHPERSENQTVSQPESVNQGAPNDQSQLKYPKNLEGGSAEAEEKLAGVKRESQNENPSNEERSKLDPNQVINLGGKQERKVDSMKSESQIWPGMPWQNDQPRRYKIRNRKTDNTSLRYECFCSRQYLSYCATYQHMVRDHPDFLHQNKRFSSTNVVETVDPVYGFKIKKIMRYRKKRKEGEPFIPGQNLSKRTKRRIREQSPHIQSLLRQLQQANLLRESYTHKLKLFGNKIESQQKLVAKYNSVIASFQKIIKILDIQPIIAELQVDNREVEYDLEGINDEEYFPE